jgi:hypothetical protein
MHHKDKLLQNHSSFKNPSQAKPVSFLMLVKKYTEVYQNLKLVVQRLQLERIEWMNRRNQSYGNRRRGSRVISKDLKSCVLKETRSNDTIQNCSCGIFCIFRSKIPLLLLHGFLLALVRFDTREDIIWWCDDTKIKKIITKTQQQS